MSNLPGNPFAQMLADTEAKTDGKMYAPEVARAIHAAQQIEATMALAYEQRLATLATLFNIPDNSAIPGVDYTEAARQLSAGLGMRGEK